MDIVFYPEAWLHYQYWADTDVKMLRRLNKLINDCTRNPFMGIGKPEALRGNLKGFWSRRIDDEHRLVYTVKDSCLHILQCRFHYDN